MARITAVITIWIACAAVAIAAWSDHADRQLILLAQEAEKGRR